MMNVTEATRSVISYKNTAASVKHVSQDENKRRKQQEDDSQGTTETNTDLLFRSVIR